jgi:DNA-binding CsgD family transcriptional regulator
VTAPHISRREGDVLRLIAEGLTDKEIASSLGVSRRTVRTYLERLFARHGIHSRTSAVAVWLRSRAIANVGGNTD